MRSVVKFLHEQYEKISDDLYLIGNNAILRFNVLLAHKSDDGTRYHYHKEFEYGSEKYNNINYNLVTIRRQFDYFLTIENIKRVNDFDKEYIMLRTQDMYYVLSQFKNAYKWFTDNAYSNLYAYDKNKNLVIYNRPESITISGLAMDKYIKLDPIVIIYENSQTQDMGIRITLSNESNYVDINIPRFEGLLYTLNSINLYQSAQLILNYLQRPEFGTNSYEFNNNLNENSGYVEAASNRQVKSIVKKKSFFDKIDDL